LETPLVDTHCHLDLAEYDTDREEVFNRAHEAGVVHFIVPGITLDTGNNLPERLAEHSDVSFAFGLHPNNADEWNDKSLDELKGFLSIERCVAVGEIGLDYYRQFVDPVVQRDIFTRQLNLAAETNLPVIIHCREAEADMTNILIQWHDSLVRNNLPLEKHPGVLHAFSGSLRMMEEFASRNFYFGIGGPITFKNSPERVSLIRSIPSDQLLLETDAPYLAPHPFRGKRNEPSHLSFIIQKLAEIRNQTVTELSSSTTRNSEKLFSREKSFV
jgi:TatD DNase family protein